MVENKFFLITPFEGVNVYLGCIFPLEETKENAKRLLKETCKYFDGHLQCKDGCYGVTFTTQKEKQYIINKMYEITENA